jgi:hypothetical protein
MYRLKDDLLVDVESMRKEAEAAYWARKLAGRISDKPVEPLAMPTLGTGRNHHFDVASGLVTHRFN